MVQKKINTGKEGESIAVRFLRANGYRIEAVNWRFRRAEIDIIAYKKPFLVFCEVKTRSGISFGDPAEAVGIKKIKLVSDAATAYMIDKGYEGEFRFDILSILMKTSRDYAINHYEDAFFPGLAEDF